MDFKGLVQKRDAKYLDKAYAYYMLNSYFGLLVK